MDASEILVLLLSITLAVLLVMSIIFMFYLIKVAITLRKITQKAEKVVDNVEVASSFFKNSAVPVAITRLVSNIMESFKGKKSKDKEEEDE